MTLGETVSSDDCKPVDASLTSLLGRLRITRVTDRFFLPVVCPAAGQRLSLSSATFPYPANRANSVCKRHGGLAVWPIASEGEDRGLKSQPASEFSKFPTNKFPTTQYFNHQWSSCKGR